MSVIDAYNKKYGNIVIYIIGMYGSHKTQFANTLAKDLNFIYINRDDYVENDIDNKDSNNVDIDDNINWDKLKSFIATNKNVIVSGSSLPPEKLDIYSHFAIHIKISKQKMIDARINFLKKHDMLKDDSEEKIKKLMDTVTYPYYLDALKTNKINKFINGNDMKETQIEDEMFSSVINFIEKKLYKDSTTVTYDDKTKQYVTINENNKHSADLRIAIDAESDSVESDSAESDSVESDSVESDSVKSDSVESDSVKSDSVESDSVESDSVESDSAESDSVESDSANKKDDDSDDSNKSDSSD
jgi:shikimate kinase